MPGSIRIYAIGNQRLMIENHLAVSEMTDSRMMLDARKGALEIRGEKLRIREIRKGAMIVEGEIAGIVFLRRGADD